MKDLDIAGEAIADLWLQSPSGMLAQIHLHAADHNLRRECHVVGSQATAAADLITGEILVTREGETPQRFTRPPERDDWHLLEAVDFVESIRHKRAPRCSIQEAARTLRVCLEAMESPLLLD